MITHAFRRHLKQTTSAYGLFAIWSPFKTREPVVSKYDMPPIPAPADEAAERASDAAWAKNLEGVTDSTEIRARTGIFG